MPTGLASLVLQASAPFTVLLAGLLLRERLTARQVAGVGLAVAGLAEFAVYRAGLSGGAALVPVLLTVCGALGWAIGNLSNRQARTAEPFRLMLWMTVVPAIPMLLVSLWLEGPAVVRDSFDGLGERQGLLALGGLAFTVVVATLGGSGIWTTLMARQPSSTVAPFSMLVPVVGIGSSWLLLGDTTSGPWWSWPACCGAAAAADSSRGSAHRSRCRSHRCRSRGRVHRPRAELARRHVREALRTQQRKDVVVAADERVGVELEAGGAVAEIADPDVLDVTEVRPHGPLGTVDAGQARRGHLQAVGDTAGQARECRLVGRHEPPAAAGLANLRLGQSGIEQRRERPSLGGGPDARAESRHGVVGVGAGRHGDKPE